MSGKGVIWPSTLDMHARYSSDRRESLSAETDVRVQSVRVKSVLRTAVHLLLKFKTY